MAIIYDIEKIKKIIDDLHRITGLSLGFMDTEYKYVYLSLNERDTYCQLITQTEEGKKRCLCSDKDMVKKCAETVKAVSHTCHAGVIDTVVPIVKRGILSGFIIIGRIRKNTTEGLPEKLSWLGGDTERVISYYNDLSYFSSEQLESLIDVISNIIFENAIDIRHNNLADAADEYIRKNLSSPLSTKELCSALFTSKNSLYSAFRNAYKTTVNEYVTEKRIERAKELLRGSDKPISRIAEEVGIGNYPYFVELFKKRCGVTPKKFRENPKEV